MSLLNRVPSVPACLRALRARVPTCPRAFRPCVRFGIMQTRYEDINLRFRTFLSLAIFFSIQIFSESNFFGPNFYFPNFFFVANFFGPNFFLGPKFFYPNFFCPHFFFYPQTFFASNFIQYKVIDHMLSTAYGHTL